MTQTYSSVVGCGGWQQIYTETERHRVWADRVFRALHTPWEVSEDPAICQRQDAIAARGYTYAERQRIRAARKLRRTVQTWAVSTDPVVIRQQNAIDARPPGFW